MPAHWYVIQTYSGQEARARAALLERAKTAGREDAIEEIFIPEESVVEVVKGERRTSKRKLVPGYMFVHMQLDDEIWHIIKNTARITGFAASRPTPIPDKEVQDMMGQAQEEKPRPRIIFEQGENVRVTNGPFNNFSGTVGDVRPERELVQVLVPVFGRPTPVWLNYEHVEKA